MARPSKPRLRYFARFKEEFGYLRAVIRNGKTRKYILTPIVVSKEQLSRLDTSGSMIVRTESDLMVNTHLHEYTRYVWDTVNPLIASGEFDNMPGWQITQAIFRTKEKAEADRYRRLRERSLAESAKKGRTIIPESDFHELLRELKATLSPQEYEALWEEKKGGNDGKL